jgi:hypothetical protein
VSSFEVYVATLFYSSITENLSEKREAGSATVNGPDADQSGCDMGFDLFPGKQRQKCVTVFPALRLRLGEYHICDGLQHPRANGKGFGVASQSKVIQGCLEEAEGLSDGIRNLLMTLRPLTSIAIRVDSSAFRRTNVSSAALFDGRVTSRWLIMRPFRAQT